MRKSKFTTEEIQSAIGRLEKGTSIEDICKKMGVTTATVYNWKKKFEVSVEKEPKNTSNKLMDLEEENYRLRQLVANLSLEKHDLLELLKNKS